MADEINSIVGLSVPFTGEEQNRRPLFETKADEIRRPNVQCSTKKSDFLIIGDEISSAFLIIGDEISSAFLL